MSSPPLQTRTPSMAGATSHFLQWLSRAARRFSVAQASHPPFFSVQLVHAGLWLHAPSIPTSATACYALAHCIFFPCWLASSGVTKQILLAVPRPLQLPPCQTRAPGTAGGQHDWIYCISQIHSCENTAIIATG